MPTELLLLGAVLFVCAVLLLRQFRPAPRRPRRGPYLPRETLLSPGELAFHRVLRQAVPAGVWICPKVRVADLVTCSRGNWPRYGRPLAGKHVDFVLADAETMRILLAVELDDRSHQQQHRRRRDAAIDTALTGAGVPVLRVPAAAHYDVREIRRQVAQALANS